MAEFIEPVEHLADMFRRLEGVGKKSALRMAFSVLDLSEESAKEFADALIAVKTKVRLCECCQNITVDALCPICSSPKRDRSQICVVFRGSITSCTARSRRCTASAPIS